LQFRASRRCTENSMPLPPTAAASNRYDGASAIEPS
jgi:hypothetical protein